MDTGWTQRGTKAALPVGAGMMKSVAGAAEARVVKVQGVGGS